jgi:hypothetical protein
VDGAMGWMPLVLNQACGEKTGTLLLVLSSILQLLFRLPEDTVKRASRTKYLSVSCLLQYSNV